MWLYNLYIPVMLTRPEPHEAKVVTHEAEAVTPTRPSPSTRLRPGFFGLKAEARPRSSTSLIHTQHAWRISPSWDFDRQHWQRCGTNVGSTIFQYKLCLLPPMYTPPTEFTWKQTYIPFPVSSMCMYILFGIIMVLFGVFLVFFGVFSVLFGVYSYR